MRLNQRLERMKASMKPLPNAFRSEVKVEKSSDIDMPSMRNNEGIIRAERRIRGRI